MTGINLESLRLNNVNVAGNDVVFGLLRADSSKAGGRTTDLSTRHPSGYPAPETGPVSRRERAEAPHAAAAKRAGRPGCLAGVSRRPSPAPSAGLATQWRWPTVSQRAVSAPSCHGALTNARLRPTGTPRPHATTYAPPVTGLVQAHPVGRTATTGGLGQRIPPVARMPRRAAGGR